MLGGNRKIAKIATKFSHFPRSKLKYFLILPFIHDKFIKILTFIF